MNKFYRIIPISLIASAISLVLCIPSITYANDKIINVVGLLITKPCEIEDTNIDVDFGIISQRDLMENLTENKSFDIKLINCPSNNIRARFTGTSTDNNQLLTFGSSSTARGAGIRLYDESGQPIIFGQETASTTGTGDIVLKFNAQVTKLESTETLSDIVGGIFSATATYEIMYN